MSDNPPDRNTPLRLKDAAAIAFPNGGITAASLRREAAKGRLVIERIAGKDFVTLAAIDEMRARCRVPAAAPTPALSKANNRPTQAEVELAKAALLIRLSKKPLKRPEPR